MSNFLFLHSFVRKNCLRLLLLRLCRFGVSRRYPWAMLWIDEISVDCWQAVRVEVEGERKRGGGSGRAVNQSPHTSAVAYGYDAQTKPISLQMNTFLMLDVIRDDDDVAWHIEQMRTSVSSESEHLVNWNTSLVNSLCHIEAVLFHDFTTRLLKCPSSAKLNCLWAPNASHRKKTIKHWFGLNLCHSISDVVRRMLPISVWNFQI